MAGGLLLAPPHSLLLTGPPSTSLVLTQGLQALDPDKDGLPMCPFNMHR